MTDPTADLQERVLELEQNTKRLKAHLDVLEEIAGRTHFVDILQTVARRLGQTFGLDRCSVFLAKPGSDTARLVASYEDPGIRDYVVNLDSYPELRQAFDKGETVVIPDAQVDPGLEHVRGKLEGRKVKSITVVPMLHNENVIGAIFLRSFRGGSSFSPEDIRFCQKVANIAARSLKTAHRIDQLENRETGYTAERRQGDKRRAALVRFLTLLLDGYLTSDHGRTDELLPDAARGELERLVDVALTVIDEEGKGR